jgi:enoyl-CoA hydratase/carnithine racemase
MSGQIEVEDRPGGLRVLTLQNEAKRNALDDGMLAQLRAAVAPESSGQVRAFLIRGEGPAFSAGYDLSSLGGAPAEGALPDQHIFEAIGLLASHPAPSVALVEGAAYGAGCELACACDFRVGSGAALLCMPPAKLGVAYAPEGLWRLERLVGLSKAKLMFLTGRKVDAYTAHQWGLLDELWLDGGAAGRAVALCDELVANAPLAVKAMKLGFEQLAGARLSEEDHRTLDLLRRQAFNSDDVKEGRAAFLEKRPPVFLGK